MAISMRMFFGLMSPCTMRSECACCRSRISPVRYPRRRPVGPDRHASRRRGPALRRIPWPRRSSRPYRRLRKSSLRAGQSPPASSAAPSRGARLRWFRANRRRPLLDHLERHGAILFGIVRQVHIRHAAASQLAEDLVLADLSLFRDHHQRPAPRAVRAAGLAVRKKLNFMTDTRSGPAGMVIGSPPLSLKVFPISTGRAGCSISTPGPGSCGRRPLRRIALYKSDGAELPEIRIPRSRQSCMELARSTGAALPRISIPVLAPTISVSSSSSPSPRSLSPKPTALFRPPECESRKRARL